LKRLEEEPTRLGLVMGVMLGRSSKKRKKEDVTQSLRYYDQNVFGQNIIDVE
jgi:hypothetical protein